MRMAWWEDPVRAFWGWAVRGLRLPNGQISWTRAVGTVIALAGLAALVAAMVGGMLVEDRETVEAWGRYTGTSR